MDEESKVVMELSKEVAYMKGQMEGMNMRIDRFYSLLESHMEKEDKNIDVMNKRTKYIYALLGLLLLSSFGVDIKPLVMSLL